LLCGEVGEGEGDPVEGGDVWMEYRPVVRRIQEPALSYVTENETRLAL